MALSELKKVGFETLAEKLNTEWMGNKCVYFGQRRVASGSPVAVSQEHFECIIDDFIHDWGDVQVGTELSLGRTYLIPNCPRYKAQFTEEKSEQFRNYLSNEFGTTS